MWITLRWYKIAIDLIRVGPTFDSHISDMEAKSEEKNIVGSKENDIELRLINLVSELLERAMKQEEIPWNKSISQFLVQVHLKKAAQTH